MDTITFIRMMSLPSSYLFLFTLFVLLLLPVVSVVEQTEEVTSSYGVDKSWPMQHGIIPKSDDFDVDADVDVDTNDSSQKRYNDFMKGCYQQGYKRFEKRPDGLYQRKDDDPDPTKEYIKKNDEEYVKVCNEAERDRIEMNLNQPKEMENYTHAGYAKVDAPSNVLQLLTKFWDTNKRLVWPEFWDDGNTYVNHWEVPTMLLDIGRKDLFSAFTKDEYEIIIKSVQDLLESWTNQRLVLTSAYGIRLYNEGSILAPHVDRLPLVSSAIINVFQHNLTEPWMLEVIGHDGIAQNLTSKPGEIILYESASVIHGRPYPLKGEGAQCGSLFVHFEPLYHTMRHAQKAGAATNMKGIDQSSKNAFEKALQEQLQKPSLHQQNEEKEKIKSTSSIFAAVNDKKSEEVPNKMPFRKAPGYVWPEYDSLYDQRFYFEYEEAVTPKASKTVFGKITAHQAASLGELNVLKAIAKESGKQELFKADHNGWRPLHEAARSGNDDIVEYLLEQGAKVNDRTNNNKGGNPLYWASKDPKKNASAIELLKKHGGINMAPIDTKVIKQLEDDDKKDTN